MPVQVLRLPPISLSNCRLTLKLTFQNGPPRTGHRGECDAERWRRRWRLQRLRPELWRRRSSVTLLRLVTVKRALLLLLLQLVICSDRRRWRYRWQPAAPTRIVVQRSCHPRRSHYDWLCRKSKNVRNTIYLYRHEAAKDWFCTWIWS